MSLKVLGLALGGLWLLGRKPTIPAPKPPAALPPVSAIPGTVLVTQEGHSAQVYSSTTVDLSAYKNIIGEQAVAVAVAEASQLPGVETVLVSTSDQSYTLVAVNEVVRSSQPASVSTEWEPTQYESLYIAFDSETGQEFATSDPTGYTVLRTELRASGGNAWVSVLNHLVSLQPGLFFTVIVELGFISNGAFYPYGASGNFSYRRQSSAFYLAQGEGKLLAVWTDRRGLPKGSYAGRVSLLVQNGPDSLIVQETTPHAFDI